MKSFLLLVLLLTSTASYAAWTKLTYSDNSRIYIDRSSIKKIGDIVEVNQLFDFFETQKSPDNLLTYQSSSGREAYNCKTNQNKTLNFAWRSGAMGSGEVVYKDKGRNDYPWEAVQKGSLSAAVKNELCK